MQAWYIRFSFFFMYLFLRQDPFKKNIGGVEFKRSTVPHHQGAIQSLQLWHICIYAAKSTNMSVIKSLYFT